MAAETITIQIKRGTDANRRTDTPLNGELGVTSGSSHLGGYLVAGDGSTLGGRYPGAGNIMPGWPSGSWLFSQQSLLAHATGPASVNVITYAPVCVPPGSTVTLAGLGAEVKGAQAAKNFRCGIYTSVAGKPSVLLGETGSMSTATTGFKSVISFAIPLRPGWYWTAFLSDANTATFEVLSTTGYVPLVPWTTSTVKRPTLYHEILAYAALPATATPLGPTMAAFPIVNLQAV